RDADRARDQRAGNGAAGDVAARRGRRRRRDAPVEPSPRVGGRPPRPDLHGQGRLRSACGRCLLAANDAGGEGAAPARVPVRPPLGRDPGPPDRGLDPGGDGVLPARELAPPSTPPGDRPVAWPKPRWERGPHGPTSRNGSTVANPL